jgi:lipoprotein-anchoring transpeptidase ErfK/SrfK
MGILSCIAYLLLHTPAFFKTTVPVTVTPLPTQSTSTPAKPVVHPTLYKYFEVVDGCGPYYQGTCVNMRSGPGTNYAVVSRLRTGMVLKIAGIITGTDGKQWYKIAQDASVRYPERITSGWYVLADAVTEFNDDGDHRFIKGTSASTTKRIVIDLSEETLYAYDGDILFMKEPISRGLQITPTPRGTFTVYAMTPSRYMQGPLPGVSDQAYDLPGVPWNLYFTVDGAVIHGAYWHDHFGEPWSHGCVNLSPENAKKLYQWADIGMPVTVQD